MKTLFYPIFVLLLCFNFANATPTELREWSTTSGHKTRAVALRVVGEKVHLKKSNGKVVKVKLALLSESDQEFLKEYFELDEDEPEDGDDDDNEKASVISGSGAEKASGLPVPLGEVTGPISHNGSNYYVYVPKSLKQERKASLLFYTHSGGGGKGQLIKRLVDGAETLGWIMAISVESKNGNGNNRKHVSDCLDHIFETLPVDEKRIHYAGNSGGAAMAFVNTGIKKAFGVMPNIGYIPNSVTARTKVVYGLGGGNDYNRYLTAYAANKFKKNGFHRMFAGGHGPPPTHFYIDGMIWMHCKYLKLGKATAAEKADFEASIINWMENLKSTAPKRVYATACVVRDVYRISGPNAKLNSSIISELAADSANVLHYEGLLDINELSRKKMAELGEDGGSKKKHFSKECARAAEKLKKKYGAVKEILDVLDTIMKTTV